MRYIIAENKRAAEATAEIDWNWKRISHDRWLDHEGEQVMYIANARQLQGSTRGSIVYKGYNYFANREYDEIKVICLMRGHELR